MNIEVGAVLAQLSERGQLEWELASLRAYTKSLEETVEGLLREPGGTDEPV